MATLAAGYALVMTRSAPIRLAAFIDGSALGLRRGAEPRLRSLKARGASEGTWSRRLRFGVSDFEPENFPSPVGSDTYRDDYRDDNSLGDDPPADPRFAV